VAAGELLRAVTSDMQQVTPCGPELSGRGLVTSKAVESSQPSGFKLLVITDRPRAQRYNSRAIVFRAAKLLRSWGAAASHGSQKGGPRHFFFLFVLLPFFSLMLSGAKSILRAKSCKRGSVRKGATRGSNRGLVITCGLPFTNGKRHRTPTSLTINAQPAEVPFTRASKRSAVRLFAPQARWCARKQLSRTSGSLQTGKIGSLSGRC
jgi:hypothetical protein